MTDPAITNYTNAKAALKKVLGKQTFESAEDGAFADGSYARRLESWLEGTDIEGRESGESGRGRGRGGWRGKHR